MADERSANAVILVDPATRTQEAGVDASGHLQVDIAASSGTVTVDNAGTFAAQIDGDALTALQLIDDVVATLGTDTYTETTTKGAVVGAVRNDTLAALAGTDNEVAPLQVDASGALYVQEGAPLDVSAATVTVDLGSNNDVTIEGGAVLGTDGSAGPANALSVGGTESDGTFQEVRTDTDGHLQVDVLSGGGTDSPTGATVDLANSTDTAAGSSSNLDSAEITEAEKLWGCDITASVAFKAIVQLVEDDAATAIGTAFGRAGETVKWRAPHRDFAAHAGASAGVDVFRVVAKNLDTSQAADLYATFFYST